MREIKFRQPRRDKDGAFLDFTYWGIDLGINDIRAFFTGPDSNPRTVRESQQFTGLKDKNGKEIYEGDVLKVCWYEYDDEPELNTYSIGGVFWGGDYPAFDIRPPIDDTMNGLQSLLGGWGEDYPQWGEVIGNIYQNPELLDSQS